MMRLHRLQALHAFTKSLLLHSVSYFYTVFLIFLLRTACMMHLLCACVKIIVRPRMQAMLLFDHCKTAYCHQCRAVELSLGITAASPTRRCPFLCCKAQFATKSSCGTSLNLLYLLSRRLVLMAIVLAATPLLNGIVLGAYGWWNRRQRNKQPPEKEMSLPALLVPPRPLMVVLATMVMPLAQAGGQLLVVGFENSAPGMAALGAAALVIVLLYAVCQAILVCLIGARAWELGIVYGTFGAYVEAQQAGEGQQLQQQGLIKRWWANGSCWQGEAHTKQPSPSCRASCASQPPAALEDPLSPQATWDDESRSDASSGLSRSFLMQLSIYDGRAGIFGELLSAPDPEESEQQPSTSTSEAGAGKDPSPAASSEEHGAAAAEVAGKDAPGGADGPGPADACRGAGSSTAGGIQRSVPPYPARRAAGSQAGPVAESSQELQREVDALAGTLRQGTSASGSGLNGSGSAHPLQVCPRGRSVRFGSAQYDDGTAKSLRDAPHVEAEGPRTEESTGFSSSEPSANAGHELSRIYDQEKGRQVGVATAPDRRVSDVSTIPASVFSSGSLQHGLPAPEVSRVSFLALAKRALGGRPHIASVETWPTLHGQRQDSQGAAVPSGHEGGADGVAVHGAGPLAAAGERAAAADQSEERQNASDQQPRAHTAVFEVDLVPVTDEALLRARRLGMPEDAGEAEEVGSQGDQAAVLFGNQVLLSAEGRFEAHEDHEPVNMVGWVLAKAYWWLFGKRPSRVDHRQDIQWMVPVPCDSGTLVIAAEQEVRVSTGPV